ncbi:MULTISPECIES: P-loop NTPase fold protein [Actinomycetes]|uniref:P-loop NTPase fold protein n=1 Tax=Actinomycetes TaxID=1760 RepID=UPI0026490958|nr:P-loop NTPase fold protein [Bifidobacterium crudilactis]
MVEKSGLRIAHIDVSRQAEAFAGRIGSSEVKTYFLQGSWGSGKSDYLRVVKDCTSLREFTFIELELWRPKDKSSLARKIFSQTNPKWSVVFTVLAGRSKPHR